MGYNKGDNYEELIESIFTKKGLLPNNFIRGGAGSNPDIQFVHSGKTYNLEVKKDLKADYGQKMVKWSFSSGWEWCKNDEVTDFYTDIGILEYVIEKNIVPSRYTIPKENITMNQKKGDQKAFEDHRDIDIKALHDYYRLKEVYYIQVGGYGFYHLSKDILELGTQQFIAPMKLRLRGKTIHSIPIYNYGFYAVLKVGNPPNPSSFDVEELNGRAFPNFKL